MQGLLAEVLDALPEQLLLLLAEEGCADAHALLGAAHRVEGEDGDAVVHEGACELQAGHAGVAYGEVEAVGKGSSHVVVIDELEAVGKEYVFHVLGAAAVFLDIVEEVV